MYSYRHNRTCLCSACGRAGISRSDRALDESVARLTASLSPPEPPPAVTSLGELMRANGKAPWEMSASEFDASAALRVEPMWGTDAPEQRSLGLKRSYLRTGTELRLDVEWAPPGGYVVLVSQDDGSTDDDPRRSFIKAAIDSGIAVAAEILAGYPDLGSG